MIRSKDIPPPKAGVGKPTSELYGALKALEVNESLTFQKIPGQNIAGELNRWGAKLAPARRFVSRTVKDNARYPSTRVWRIE